jgi:hypothetical protein
LLQLDVRVALDLASWEVLQSHFCAMHNTLLMPLLLLLMLMLLHVL